MAVIPNPRGAKNPAPLKEPLKSSPGSSLKRKISFKTDPNKRQMVLGLALIVFAFLCVLGLFYFLVDSQRMNLEKIGSLEGKMKNLELEKEKVHEELQEWKQAPPKPISVSDIVVEAEKMYGLGQQNQQNGFLWIDRQADTYIVTLGVLNGLKQGSFLTLYDGNKKVGKVVVQLPLDVISYVDFVNNDVESLAKDYYQVAIE